MQFRIPTPAIKALGNAQQARRLERHLVAGLAAGLDPAADPVIGDPARDLVRGLLSQARELAQDAEKSWKSFDTLQEAQAEQKKRDGAVKDLEALLDYLKPAEGELFEVGPERDEPRGTTHGRGNAGEDNRPGDGGPLDAEVV